MPDDETPVTPNAPDDQALADLRRIHESLRAARDTICAAGSALAGTGRPMSPLYFERLSNAITSSHDAEARLGRLIGMFDPRAFLPGRQYLDVYKQGE